MANNVDIQVEKELEDCITEGSQNSFFLFAGAGSGKTHSLIELLNKIERKWANKLSVDHRQVAVITYTNAATDEILRRLGYNPLFHVSTIHSFVWDVIKTYQNDIRKYYKDIKSVEIQEITEKLSKSKSTTTKTYISNQEKLSKLTKRLERLDSDVKKFIYNPNGDNLTKDSLSHADVISIGCRMIFENVLLQKVIVQQYPFFLVDESQDTKRELVSALYNIQKRFPNEFTLGFLGDVKQRIYMDGAENMSEMASDTWAKPVKRMNYRCAKRIIELSNKIALTIDANGEQIAKDDAPEGTVHLFLVNNGLEYDTDRFETEVGKRMSSITSDEKWLPEKNEVKILTLEHLMAARRLGFAGLHDALSHVSKYQMSYLQGEIPELTIFNVAIFPLIDMLRAERGAEALAILKKYSPLLNLSETENPKSNLRECNDVIKELLKMVDSNKSIREIISYICENEIFEIGDELEQASKQKLEDLDKESLGDEVLLAWVKVMDLGISQLSNYYQYTQGNTKYGTHQGVKGFEFPRVLVILNDNEANGFLFSYDKLFGVKAFSDTDLEHIRNGEESVFTRTTRLLYVTCTRAKESLALLMYTPNPEKAKQTAIENEWFDEDEITVLS